jgi:hypothetical protein
VIQPDESAKFSRRTAGKMSSSADLAGARDVTMEAACKAVRGSCAGVHGVGVTCTLSQCAGSRGAAALRLGGQGSSAGRRR